MDAKKYVGKILGTEDKITGYLIEQRGYLTNGCYSDKKQYSICVTEFSMPNSVIRGCFIVDEKSLLEFYPCLVCGKDANADIFFDVVCSKKCYDEL